MSTTRKPSLRQLVKEIDGSATAAQLHRDMAATLRKHHDPTNDYVRDAVQRFLSMADEFDRDVDDRWETLMDWYPPEQYEAFMESAR